MYTRRVRNRLIYLVARSLGAFAAEALSAIRLGSIGWARWHRACHRRFGEAKRGERGSCGWRRAHSLEGGLFGNARYCFVQKTFHGRSYRSFYFAHQFSTFQGLGREAFRRAHHVKQVSFWSQNPNFVKPPPLRGSLSRVSGSKLVRDRKQNENECGTRFIGYAPILSSPIYGRRPTEALKEAWKSFCSGTKQTDFKTGTNIRTSVCPLQAWNSWNSWAKVSSRLKCSVSAWTTSLHMLAAFRVPQDTIVMEENEREASSFVDFDFSTQLSLPSVAELTAETVDTLERDIETHINELRALVADVKRVANLGELPVSIEKDGQILRVHFPNADSDKVEILMDDVEATRGVVVDAVGNRHLANARSSSGMSDAHSMTDSELFTSSSFEDIMTPGLTQSESSADEHTEAISDMVMAPVVIV